MNHFINTDCPDFARARTVGLQNLIPAPFPVLVVGRKSNHTFFFANAGVMESWSGSQDYRLRVTIGNAIASPIGSTFTLTVGSESPLTVPFDITQAGLQNILNDSAQVTADGGVDVVAQGLGRFLIAYRSLGIPATISSSGSLLLPDSSASLETLATGSASVRQLLMLTLARITPAQVTIWNTVSSPYSGWTGVIPLDSAAAIELLRVNGVVRGDFLECTTLITVEVIDDNANPAVYYQAPVLLRALNYTELMSTTLAVGPTSNIQTNSSGNSTVAPTSQIHTETITISGSASVRNILVQSTGLVAGARIDLVLLFTGSNGTQVKVYANSTGGTLLFDFTRAGDEPNGLFVLYADGNGSFKDKNAIIPAFSTP